MDRLTEQACRAQEKQQKIIDTLLARSHLGSTPAQSSSSYSDYIFPPYVSPRSLLPDSPSLPRLVLSPPSLSAKNEPVILPSTIFYTISIWGLLWLILSYQRWFIS